MAASLQFLLYIMLSHHQVDVLSLLYLSFLQPCGKKALSLLRARLLDQLIPEHLCLQRLLCLQVLLSLHLVCFSMESHGLLSMHHLDSLLGQVLVG